MAKSKKIAFGWYGGKYNYFDWLLPLLLLQPWHFNNCMAIFGEYIC
ncbi:hypothetical protein A0J48_001435 [Sphaerospermopsis aphanizomenoides BCCUSP55]|nr:hypothetical protein [Sphaerospermopsis aphanizomenoides]MBK1986225.1 hypothetical protein [Sphaerospermopsis aphanizomenoides BCCUSP55]